MRENGQPTIVDFIENALGASTEEISRVIRETPELVVERMDDVYALMEDTWIDYTLEEQRAREIRGELWPVMPSMLADVVSLARAQRADHLNLGRSSSSRKTKVVTQSLLLYAHGIHMANPLLTKRTDLRVEARFLNGVSDVCALAPLISAGVVRVHAPLPDPLSLVSRDMVDKMDEWGARLGRAMRAYEGHLQVLNQDLLRLAGDALLSRALANILDFSHRRQEVSGSLVFPTEYDNATMSMIAAEFGSPASDRHPDVLRLDRLARLSLPGLRALQLREMVNIRTDESFGVFRSDMAAAMNESSSDIERGSIDRATRTIAEHMDAGLAKLNARTSRGILRDATVPGLISWGLGAAAATSVADWKGFVATLLGKATADWLMKRPSRGEGGLRSHYIELGTKSLGFEKRTTFVAPESTHLQEMHTDRAEARRSLLRRLRGADG